MPTSFKMDSSWARLEAVLDPAKFGKKLKSNIRRANGLNAAIVKKEVRKAIKKGGYAPNAALTVAVKKSTKPLVDMGHTLFQAISSSIVSDTEAFVGVLKTDDAYNIAMALHEGVTIEVTPKMRGLFWVLWKASTGSISPDKLTGRAKELWERMPGGWKPLGKATKAIIIPPRPFLRFVFSNESMRAAMKKNWEDAIAGALQVS